MRTAVYIRVSTEEQAKEGFSVAAQRERLLAYIRSQGWTLADIYADEGESAKDTRRPALQRMLADVRLGRIDVVLVYRLDRLTRSVLDLYRLLSQFERYGVRFKSCTEVYDTTTAIGRLFITLVAALAQWERENLAERVKLGMEQMVRERKRPGGPPPYGYEWQDGRLVVHPTEGEAVRGMFRHFLAGWTPRQIAEWANHEGFRGKHGARWSPGAVTRLLKNPVYYGALRWNYAEGGQRLNRPEKWMLVERAHPAIVDASTFAAVQQRLAERRSLHPRVLSSPFIFSGLLYCSRCGSPMRGKTARTKKPNGKRYTHHYYLCKNRQKGGCQAAAIREDRLAREVISHLHRYGEELRAACREAVASGAAQTEMAAAEALLKKCRQRRKRWEDAYAEGLITLGEYRAKLGELKQAEQEALAAAQCRPLAAVSDEWQEMLADWSSIWESATREERRQLADILLRRLEADTCPSASGSGLAVRLTLLAFR
ncbi:MULTISPECIES: recombinase family protein [Bacillales]|jgi:site-specific DNA recombinase|uniref:recombinase family protein n=1 Tax=Brevibacillus TaxID=55080 RepID=UPI0014918396|nr:MULTISPECIES: recombinase family protein [Bacillales]NNV04343.1 recombinase family protein [Brevibacillus sp. MCWH]UFJ61433.1 recombinase family protein [Anoxybacillus sediminis]